VWDANTGAEVCKTNGHTSFVPDAVFSPNGTQIPTASWDLTARVWDARTCAAVSVLGPHLGVVREAVFSPDGKIVATASGDPSNLIDLGRQAVKLWDAQTGISIAELRGHTRPLWSVAFNSDGTLLMTASLDTTVRVWDVSWVTAWSGRGLLAKVCKEKLVGAQTFLPEELQQPVLSGTGDKNPCARIGSMNLQYWEDAVANLWHNLVIHRGEPTPR
jgi:WD40 repeat protein